MFTFTAIGLFSVFVANVVIGANGGTQFLGDVGEMIVLFCASLAFVVVTLQKETAEKSKDN
ncbi:hypothetical protein [Shimia abyssi]|uniref:Uncharacterized protein n=1 Tax=Shimia abyssi TaxID=1662395 RepID=A0A2P8F8U0_9RHOB|nr:hypothetical protein [Shimia abyssi]PSL18118.1 hypothetical protein CLV88_11242 [Shimia abyssi]